MIINSVLKLPNVYVVPVFDFLNSLQDLLSVFDNWFEFNVTLAELSLQKNNVSIAPGPTFDKALMAFILLEQMLCRYTKASF